jgi:hypothetical protein
MAAASRGGCRHAKAVLTRLDVIMTTSQGGNVKIIYNYAYDILCGDFFGAQQKFCSLV